MPTPGYGPNSGLRDFIVQYSIDHPDPDFGLSDPASTEDMAVLLMSIIRIHFSQIALPGHLRDPIYGLLGVCAHIKPTESGWYYIRDKEFAPYLMDEVARTANTVRQRLKRFRQNLPIWQCEQGIELIEIRPGGGEAKRDRWGVPLTNSKGQTILNAIPTGYKLHFIRAAMDVVKHYQVLRGMTKFELKAAVKQMQAMLTIVKKPVKPVSLHKKRVTAERAAIKKVREVLELFDLTDCDPVLFLLELEQATKRDPSNF